MTKADVVRWQSGWTRIKQLETAEAKHQSFTERLSEISALYTFAARLGLLKPASETELAPIRARWARLKARYP